MIIPDLIWCVAKQSCQTSRHETLRYNQNISFKHCSASLKYIAETSIESDGWFLMVGWCWVELRKIGASEAMDQLPVWILGDLPVLGMTQTSHFRCNLRRIQRPFPAALVCAAFCMLLPLSQTWCQSISTHPIRRTLFIFMVGTILSNAQLSWTFSDFENFRRPGNHKRDPHVAQCPMLRWGHWAQKSMGKVWEKIRFR